MQNHSPNRIEPERIVRAIYPSVCICPRCGGDRSKVQGGMEWADDHTPGRLRRRCKLCAHVFALLPLAVEIEIQPGRSIVRIIG